MDLTPEQVIIALLLVYITISMFIQMNERARHRREREAYMSIITGSPVSFSKPNLTKPPDTYVNPRRDKTLIDEAKRNRDQD